MDEIFIIHHHLLHLTDDSRSCTPTALSLFLYVGADFYFYGMLWASVERRLFHIALYFIVRVSRNPVSFFDDCHVGLFPSREGRRGKVIS